MGAEEPATGAADLKAKTKPKPEGRTSVAAGADTLYARQPMRIRTLTATLTGIIDYSSSRFVRADKKPDESDAAFDLRTWRDKAHSTETGHVYIPPMAVKDAIDTAAKRAGTKIAGRGAALWSKVIQSGVLCMSNVLLFRDGKPVLTSDLVPLTLFCDVRGIKGGSQRVMRTFPMVPAGWTAQVVLSVIDDSVPRGLLEDYLYRSGVVVGVGRFRPAVGGYNGRYTVSDCKWTDQ